MLKTTRFKTFFFSLAALFFFSTTAVAQSAEQDWEQFEAAARAQESGNLEKAVRLFKNVESESCATAEANELCFEAKRKVIVTQRTLGNREVSLNLLDNLEKFVHTSFGSDLYKLAIVYRNKMFIELSRPDMEEALRWSNKLYQITQNNKSSRLTKAVSYAAVGYFEDSDGNYEEAIQNYKKSIELSQEIDNLDETGKILIQALNNIGVAYRRAGEIELAREQYETNLDLTRRVYGENHIEMATAYNNIGTIYYIQQDIGRAAEYFIRSAGIIERNFGPDHSRLGAALNNAGLCYYGLENYEKAASYLERAQRVKEASLGMNHPESAIGYSNLASIHIQNEDYEAAEQNYLRSIAVRENNFGENHPSLVDPKIQIGKLYLNYLDRPEQGRRYFTSALSIGLDRLVESHPDVADAFMLIGQTYHNEGNYSEALNHYRQAMELLYGPYNLQENPDFERPFADPVKIVEILQSISGAYRHLSPGFDKNDYQHAYRAAVWAVDLIDVLQLSYKNESSKLRLVDQNYSIFTSAVEVLSELYSHTDDEEYLHEMFKFIEKSRGRVALELLQNVSAQSFAGVPQHIIESENDFNAEIDRLQQNVFSEQEKGDDANRKLIQALQDSVFIKKRQYEDFARNIEKQYPVYYDLKYDQSVISLNGARSLLKEDETMISYVLGSEQIYALILSREDVNVTTFPRPERFTENIDQLRENIIRGESDKYKERAHQLYEGLFKPLEPYISGQNVLIMPDQGMHYLPFEVLLTNYPDHTTYEKMPYLLKEYTISYVPSATVLNIMDERKPENPANLLAVAPFSSEIVRPEVEVNEVEYASTVGPLLLTRHETQSIASLFSEKRSWSEYFKPHDVKLLAGSNATLGKLKETDLIKYNYIHFATHAFINRNNPAFSGIMMYPDDEGSSVSYISDIYNMELNADLVVLGACETGLGSSYRGEGLIGFTRAFIYAGASNLVVSMWKVNDQSTMYLMIDFYDHIRDGYSYSEALRQAKLNAIRKPNMADPVNWASFILTGR